MHYRQNNKERKTYVQGLRSFGSILPRGLRGVLKKSGYNYSEIISKWKELVGEEISNCSYPKSIKMSGNNKDGILIIAVKRGNEITLEYSKNEIMDKINSYFGYQLIKEIKLLNFNAKTKKKNKIKNEFSKNLEKKIEEIKSNNIKKSLHQLLKAAKNE
tara:strand:+ start:430 stop:906 length:477 start_codon:yes stop_codon:yes gene_type:complete